MNRTGKQPTGCETPAAGTVPATEAYPQPVLSDLDPAALRRSTRRKHAVAQLVHQLADLLRRAGDEPRAAAAHELLVKLAEDRFTLAVVGQFKRGKSSLINAIVGREVLPTGVLPLTSAITILRYGSRERLLIHRAGSRLTEEAPLSALPEFVTQEGNPSNRKRMEAVYVELPVRFLRRGLEFVDTPGIGSAVEPNTATTCSFMPRCDAVLFVTGVEAPLTTIEAEFLRTIRQHVTKVFFVLNKIDLMDEREVGQVADHMRRSLEEPTGTDAIKVFPVSSRRALQQARVGEADSSSGLPVLEEALARFLATESAATFLTSIMDKARRLCLEACARATMAAKAELMTLDKRLAALAQGDEPGDAEPGPGAETAIVTEPGETFSIEPPAPTVADIERVATLQARGCLVCNYLEQVAFDFFRHSQFGLATQERVQQQFAVQHGFCTLHTWQLASLASPQGLSRGLAPLVEHAAAEMGNQTAAPDAPLDRLAGQLVDADRCQVCVLLRKAESDFTGRLATFVDQEAGRSAYARTRGVCLRHLDGLLAAVPTDAPRRFLLSNTARRFSDLAEDMRSYALKHEALLSGLATGDEHDAYRRAIVHLVGNKWLCLPFAEERG